MITKKSKQQIEDKCNRLYHKASEYMTMMDDSYYNPQIVKWSSKGNRLMRRAMRTADLLLDTV